MQGCKGIRVQGYKRVQKGIKGYKRVQKGAKGCKRVQGCKGARAHVCKGAKGARVHVRMCVRVQRQMHSVDPWTLFTFDAWEGYLCGVESGVHLYLLAEALQWAKLH